MHLIVYQSSKKTRYRVVNYTTRKIGEETSMGWTVLTIQHYYNGRFYSIYEYQRKLEKERYRFNILLKRKTKVKKIIDFLYYMSH